MRRRPFITALLPAGFAGTRGALAAPPTASVAPVSTAQPTDASAASDVSAPSVSPASPRSDAAPADVSPRPLRFPADHGAHPDTHIEWWYVTGWLRTATGDAAAPPPSAPPEFGFQVTFFRVRTGLGDGSASAFAPRQLVFADVALTDLAAGRSGSNGRGLMHDQRAAREGFGLVRTPGPAGTQAVQLRDWLLSRAAPPAGAADSAPGAGAQRIDVRADRFGLALALQSTQPVLLQGDGGYSRKGPLPQEASHYYSEPQLAVRGHVERAGQPAREVVGRAWLDHEWSDAYLPPEAAGWDWVGFNLLDGAALMAFRMRRADGSTLWAGGSWRDAAGTLRVFAPGELAFRPLRHWTSARTHVAYPVEWQLDTPAGRFHVAALQDDQELDSRGSTGALYWEGLSALSGADGRVVGWGYLELTGYADRLRL